MKLLTVDDSRTVRIIVNKAFKPYAVTILEASNGEEGLAIAAKEVPDLILLDVTMPVMDGIEMLTRLKANSELKNIPIIMLTAEGGRETVLKIARIGVRDYIVKPFKEDVLIAKVSRIVKLDSLTKPTARVRTINDALDILLVEDKPAIVKQVVEGLASIEMPWKIQAVSSAQEALDYLQGNRADLILVSLNLPDDTAFDLGPSLRARSAGAPIPMIGIVVKTDSERSIRAQREGFYSLVTKPLEIEDLAGKIVRALRLDMMPRYFAVQPDHMLVRIPRGTTTTDILDIGENLAGKLTEAVDSGISLVVGDMTAVQTLDVALVKFLTQLAQACRDLSVRCAFIGNPTIIEQRKGFTDTQALQFHESLDEIKALVH